MNYCSFTRNCHSYVLSLMEQFPVVAIIGARQVGKTTLAKSVASDFLYMDLEKPSDYDRLVRDPEFLFKQHPKGIVFDEAQECKALFSVLRGVIDEQRQIKGRFILTGSSSPDLLENISETLAGRIAIIELGTLKANEIYQQPLSPFYDFFKQKLVKEDIHLTDSFLNLQQMQSTWHKGGYPEPITENESHYQEWMTQYELSYLQRDIARLFPTLDKITYRRFLTMLGKLSSNIINKSDLARALGVSEPTIRRYLDIANGTFLWRQLPSFENNVTKSTIKMPRGHIRDSGLLHHLLRIRGLADLQADPIAGFSFESFVIEEILKGLQDNGIRNFDYYYYRTRAGSEIDLILDGDFGLLPIEIKYGSTILKRQLRGMTEFIQAQGIPFGIIVNQASHVEWLTESIIQIPVNYI